MIPLLIVAIYIFCGMAYLSLNDGFAEARRMLKKDRAESNLSNVSWVLSTAAGFTFVLIVWPPLAAYEIYGSIRNWGKR